MAILFAQFNKIYLPENVTASHGLVKTYVRPGERIFKFVLSISRWNFQHFLYKHSLCRRTRDCSCCVNAMGSGHHLIYQQMGENSIDGTISGDSWTNMCRKYCLFHSKYRFSHTLSRLHRHCHLRLLPRGPRYVLQTDGRAWCWCSVWTTLKHVKGTSKEFWTNHLWPFQFTFQNKVNQQWIFRLRSSHWQSCLSMHRADAVHNKVNSIRMNFAHKNFPSPHAPTPERCDSFVNIFQHKNNAFNNGQNKGKIRRSFHFKTFFAIFKQFLKRLLLYSEESKLFRLPR